MSMPAAVDAFVVSTASTLLFDVSLMFTAVVDEIACVMPPYHEIANIEADVDEEMLKRSLYVEAEPWSDKSPTGVVEPMPTLPPRWTSKRWVSGLVSP